MLTSLSWRNEQTSETIIFGDGMNDIEMFEFGIKQILEITVTMLIIVILGNIIPVRKVTKQKPIDTILDK